MAFSLTGFIKGLLVQEQNDRTKELSIEVDSAATTGTRTTVKSAQTADRAVNLPDADDTLVGKATTDTLTNKTIDGDDNTVQDLALTTLKIELGNANKVLRRDAAGIVVDDKDAPVGDFVGTTDTQALTNKTIDADLNSFSNIDNADIKVGAAIDATKVHDGTVSNVEYGHLDGVTSGIQAQLDSKADISGATDNRLVRTDGTDGIQESGITVSDLNDVTGVNDLTVTGDLTVNGTTTTLNTATVDVEDANITINKNGNQAGADDTAGLTVEMSDATDASLIYDKDATSRFRIGDVGSEVEVADISSVQVVTNKTIDADNNTISNLVHGAEVDNPSSGVHGVVGDVVGTTDAQVLTAKDIDGGTASNTSRLTIPKNTKANLDGLTRKEATLVYADDIEKFLVDNGTDLIELGTGSDGSDIGTVDNASIANSVSAGALTVSLKQLDGSTDPTALSPTTIAMRSSVISNGSTNLRTVTSALSIVIPSGATLGHGDGEDEYIYVYALDNAGTVELAVSSVYKDVSELQTSTAISASSDDSGLFSTVARTNVPLRLLGRMKTNQITAGTWAAVPSSVVMITPDVVVVPTDTLEISASPSFNFGGSSAFFDQTTFILGPGKYLIEATGLFDDVGGATLTANDIVISNTIGDNLTGANRPINWVTGFYNPAAGADASNTLQISNYTVDVTTSITFYFKARNANSVNMRFDSYQITVKRLKL